MTEFTEGPWEIRGDINTGGGVEIYGDEVWLGNVLNDHHTKGERPQGGFPGNKEALANAHLIAAAPEMFELLDEIVGETLDGKSKGEVSTYCIEKIRTLLVKAQGI